jgi:RAB protein geranylgeranyltransferase component A
LDSNQYYGGPDAAFSLDEAHEWVKEVNQGELYPRLSQLLIANETIAIGNHLYFKDASIFIPQQTRDPSDSAEDSELPKLASNRAYTLSLSPSFLHARSALMSALVSSKVFRQLEFMAVGSWWIYAPEKSDCESSELGAEKVLHRVPGNREDVFAASHISMKSKRTLMRLLRHITKSTEDGASDENEDLSMPFKEYLRSNFSVPEELHDPLLSLSLSQLSQQDTLASYSVPRIQRHLASIGHLGPGFGAVIAKYGGTPEILQAACRASAVGGAVYALDTRTIDCKLRTSSEYSEHPFLVTLANEGDVQTKFLFSDLTADTTKDSRSLLEVARSVTVVSGTFPSLFPRTVEGTPLPATAVLMFPGHTLGSPASPPVYLQVHSSDTGECPLQQSKSLFALS